MVLCEVVINTCLNPPVGYQISSLDTLLIGSVHHSSQSIYSALSPIPVNLWHLNEST
jgi:hypothetical protein